MPMVVPSQVVRFIERAFPGVAEQRPSIIGHTSAPTLRSLVRLLDAIPSHLMPGDAEDFANLTIATEAARYCLARWEHHTNEGEFGDIYPLHRHPLLIIRDVLGRCKDEAPTPETTGLEFVDDSELRNQLRSDMSAAVSALQISQFKTATVLAGSVMEALLLWALEKTTRPVVDAAFSAVNRPIPSTKPFVEWMLGHYIEAAEVAGLIDQDTASQARLAQNFRNLIHPGKAIRRREQCDRGTALGALAGMERVASKLKARFPPVP